MATMIISKTLPVQSNFQHITKLILYNRSESPVPYSSLFPNLKILKVTDPHILIDEISTSVEHLTATSVTRQSNNYPDGCKFIRITYDKSKMKDEDKQVKVPSTISCNLRTLSLDPTFNFPINFINTQLTAIILTSQFNHPIDNLLPSSLLSLSLGDNFNQSINHLPNKLERLFIGNKFNKSLDNIPDTIEHLVIGWRAYLFGKDSIIWPSNIVFRNDVTDSNGDNIKENSYDGKNPQYRLGCDFNQPITRLPSGLKTLYISNNFSASLCTLPQSLTHIHMGHSFNDRIEYWPSNIQYIFLGNSYEHIITNLPPSLQTLSNVCINRSNRSINLPKHSNISYLNIYDILHITHLPQSITCLKLASPVVVPLKDFEWDLSNIRRATINLCDREKYALLDHFHSITRLHIRSDIEGDILNIPQSVKTLKINSRVVHSGVLNIPKGVNEFIVGSLVTAKIGTIPTTLQKLTLGKHFNHLLPHLDTNIKHLSIFNEKYSHHIQLPEKIESVSIFNPKLTELFDKYPKSLKILYIYQNQISSSNHSSVIRKPEFTTVVTLGRYI